MSRPLLIFLAEDNLGDIGLVREALGEHGIDYELYIASDGPEAKNYIARMGETADAPCPDLIVLDLNLPKAGGYDLFEKFRAHPLCVTTPVIVMTSSNAQQDRERAASMGAARYFRKPTDLDEFLEFGRLVREVTAGHERPDGYVRT